METSVHGVVYTHNTYVPAEAEDNIKSGTQETLNY